MLFIVIRQTRRYAAQARLVKHLVEAGNLPVVLAAAREPCDLELFKNAPLSVATYGDPPATIRALARLFVEE